MFARCTGSFGIPGCRKTGFNSYAIRQTEQTQALRIGHVGDWSFAATFSQPPDVGIIGPVGTIPRSHISDAISHRTASTRDDETTVRITGELTVAGEDDQRRFIRDLPVPKRNHPASRTIQRQHMACHCLIFARKHADLRGKQRSGQRRLTVAGKSARARRT